MSPETDRHKPFSRRPRHWLNLKVVPVYREARLPNCLRGRWSLARELSARTLLCYGQRLQTWSVGTVPLTLHRNLALSDGAVPWLPVSLPPALGSATHARTADPLRTTPQMKSPHRSHHVRRGPAGWKRWPRPGDPLPCGVASCARRDSAQCIAHAEPSAPWAAHRSGASSRNSMSQAQRTWFVGPGSGRFWALASAGRAGRGAGPDSAPPGFRQSGGRAEESRAMKPGRPRCVGPQAEGRRARLGAALSESPPSVSYPPFIPRATSPLNNHDDLKGPRGNRCL